MNLSNIEKSFTQIAENVNYSWKKPSTYLVMVPGLSIVIQKIQLAKVLPLIEEFQKQPKEADEKIEKICQNLCMALCRIINSACCLYLDHQNGLSFFLIPCAWLSGSCPARLYFNKQPKQ